MADANISYRMSQQAANFDVLKERQQLPPLRKPPLHQLRSPLDSHFADTSLEPPRKRTRKVRKGPRAT
eukprot:2165706-Rhodomonas_salina.2